MEIHAIPTLTIVLGGGRVGISSGAGSPLDDPVSEMALVNMDSLKGLV